MQDRKCENCWKRLIYPRCSIPAVFSKKEYDDSLVCRSHQFKDGELMKWEKENNNVRTTKN